MFYNRSTSNQNGRFNAVKWANNLDKTCSQMLLAKLLLRLIKQLVITVKWSFG